MGEAFSNRAAAYEALGRHTEAQTDLEKKKTLLQ